jgi:hypothetical protein
MIPLCMICQSHNDHLKNSTKFVAQVAQKFTNKYSAARMPQKFY